jgi:hypothetical protein
MHRKQVLRISVLFGVATSAVLVWFTAFSARSSAQETAQSEVVVREDTSGNRAADDVEAVDAVASQVAAKKPPVVKLPEPKGAKRLSPEHDVWIDPKRKAVLVDGQISLREGMLEMFACTRNTKEHESIVSANTKAYIVHAALLSLGAEAGRPVQFVPKYRPPSGSEIEVTVEWLDERGKPQTAKAQDWIMDINTKKPMAHPFVFAGSSFWTDEETGKKYYQAEGGDFICVSNFGTAMLDIPIESSQANSDLAFEAYTKRIPPLGAPVRLVLRPKKAGEEREAKNGQATKAESTGEESKAEESKAEKGGDR